MTPEQVEEIVHKEISDHEKREQENIEKFMQDFRGDFEKMKRSTSEVVEVWTSIGTVGQGIVWFGKVCFSLSAICASAWAAMHIGGK